MSNSDSKKVTINTGGGSISGSIIDGENNSITNTFDTDSKSVDSIKKISKELDELLNEAQQKPMSGKIPNNIEAGAIVVRKIEDNAPLRNRVFKAIRTGGIEALEKCLEHPAAVFLIAALKDFFKEE